MKFVQLLDEKFDKGIDIAGRYIEIFKNPNKKELETVLDAGGYSEIRMGITDDSNPDIYIWDANVIHDTMKKYLKFDLGLSYDYDKKSIITFDSYIDFKHYKNTKPLIKKLKSLFPSINTANISTTISIKKIKIKELE